MNEKKNFGLRSDESPARDVTQKVTNRTKWEKENKGEKKGFLVRSAEDREARRALKDFQRDYMWEHLDERSPDDRNSND